MNIRVFLLFLLIAQSVSGQKAFFYSYEQLLNRKENDELPLPKITLQEISTKMKSVVVYPRFAKSKNIETEVLVEVSINEKGVVTQYRIDMPGFLMFDTLAIQILKQIEKDWLPAKSYKVAQSSVINIPVSFRTAKSLDLNKQFYQVEVFPSRLTFILDSSTTFPACIRLRDSILAVDSITKKHKTKY